MGKMFSFNAADYADLFASCGYVHIPNGLTEQFHKRLVSYIESSGDQKLADFALGNKQQVLYEFVEPDHYEELRETVGTICKLDASSLVLSERHIKAYEANANPYPLAHKDRFGSEIAVGFSIHVPEGSTLVLYPDHDVSENPFNSTAELRASFSKYSAPDAALKHARRVEIVDRPRDVMMFRGNALWHLREHAAGTTVMYLKLNTYNCDTLGEDPHTMAARRRTLDMMASSAFLAARPVIARTVDYVHRRYNRDWNEVFGVVMFGQPHLTITATEFEVLQLMDGQRTVAHIAEEMKICGKADVSENLRRLAECGVVELLTEAMELGQVRRHFGNAHAVNPTRSDIEPAEFAYALNPQD